MPSMQRKAWTQWANASQCHMLRWSVDSGVCHGVKCRVTRPKQTSALVAARVGFQDCGCNTMPSVSYYHHILCEGNLELPQRAAKNECLGKLLFLVSVFTVAAEYFTSLGLSASSSGLSTLGVDLEGICTADPEEFG